MTAKHPPRLGEEVAALGRQPGQRWPPACGCGGRHWPAHARIASISQQPISRGAEPGSLRRARRTRPRPEGRAAGYLPDDPERAAASMVGDDAGASGDEGLTLSAHWQCYYHRAYRPPDFRAILVSVPPPLTRRFRRPSDPQCSPFLNAPRPLFAPAAGRNTGVFCDPPSAPIPHRESISL